MYTSFGFLYSSLQCAYYLFPVDIGSEWCPVSVVSPSFIATKMFCNAMHALCYNKSTGKQLKFYAGLNISGGGRENLTIFAIMVRQGLTF